MCSTRLHEEGANHVVVVPLGFISDHMEVLFDLDHEAKDHATALGMHLERAATVGTHPQFVAMIRELIVERMTDFAGAPRRRVTRAEPRHLPGQLLSAAIAGIGSADGLNPGKHARFPVRWVVPCSQGQESTQICLDFRDRSQCQSPQPTSELERASRRYRSGKLRWCRPLCNPLHPISLSNRSC